MDTDHDGTLSNAEIMWGVPLVALAVAGNVVVWLVVVTGEQP